MATNISFIRCQFSKNKCAVLQAYKGKGIVNVFFESLNVSYNMPIRTKCISIISIKYMNVYFIGPVHIILNHCKASIIQLISCNVTFNGKTKFDTNYCKHVVSLNTYLTIMEYTNITFVNNRYEYKLISVEDDTGYYQPHPFCLFQYVTNKSTVTTKILLTHYVIAIYHNYPVSITGLRLPQYSPASFCYFTSHCQWLPSAGFYGHAPKDINKQIIKHDYQECGYHTHICYCSKIEKYNCSIDILGKVYPGQTCKQIFAICITKMTVVFCMQKYMIQIYQPQLVRLHTSLSWLISLVIILTRLTTLLYEELHMTTSVSFS